MTAYFMNGIPFDGIGLFVCSNWGILLDEAAYFSLSIDLNAPRGKLIRAGLLYDHIR